MTTTNAFDTARFKAGDKVQFTGYISENAEGKFARGDVLTVKDTAVSNLPSGKDTFEYVVEDSKGNNEYIFEEEALPVVTETVSTDPIVSLRKLPAIERIKQITSTLSINYWYLAEALVEVRNNRSEWARDGISDAISFAEYVKSNLGHDYDMRNMTMLMTTYETFIKYGKDEKDFAALRGWSVANVLCLCKTQEQFEESFEKVKGGNLTKNEARAVVHETLHEAGDADHLRSLNYVRLNIMIPNEMWVGRFRDLLRGLNEQTDAKSDDWSAGFITAMNSLSNFMTSNQGVSTITLDDYLKEGERIYGVKLGQVDNTEADKHTAYEEE